MVKLPALKCLKCGKNDWLYPPNRSRKCRPCGNRASNEWYWRNRGRSLKVARARMLRREYGITAQEYEDLLANQKGGCAICGNPPTSRRLAVDHNHKTGKIRGLLCQYCNVVVGVVELGHAERVEPYLKLWNEEEDDD